jgi:hypothetical protein
MLTGYRSMTREIKKDVTKGLENDEAILDNQAAIKNDTSEILQEIARLRAQLPDDGATLLPSKKDAESTLAGYLDDLTSCAETVCWSGEDSDTDGEKEDAERAPKTVPTQTKKFVPSLPHIPANAQGRFSQPKGQQYSLMHPYLQPTGPTKFQQWEAQQQLEARPLESRSIVDRTPLQKLEGKLDDISKEERRASVTCCCRRRTCLLISVTSSPRLATTSPSHGTPFLDAMRLQQHLSVHPRSKSSSEPHQPLTRHPIPTINTRIRIVANTFC